MLRAHYEYKIPDVCKRAGLPEKCSVLLFLYFHLLFITFNFLLLLFIYHLYSSLSLLIMILISLPQATAIMFFKRFYLSFTIVDYDPKIILYEMILILLPFY